LEFEVFASSVVSSIAWRFGFDFGVGLSRVLLVVFYVQGYMRFLLEVQFIYNVFCYVVFSFVYIYSFCVKI